MSERGRILVIDDDESFRSIVEYTLKKAGYEVVSRADGSDGLKCLETDAFDMVVTDIKLPGMDGMEVLREIRRRYPETSVIVITAYGSIEMAVEAMREGAYDYITKPLNRDAFLISIERASQYRILKEENLRLREALGEQLHADRIIGSSSAITNLIRQIQRVAETDATVLITGETGTGKDLVARAIHYNSARKDHPFVVVNCAAIPRDLLESELFGHVKGAFTGATRDRKGKFHAAHHGTLFLDEIGSMEISLQAKLLRVLQDQQVTRVGEEKPTKLDVRIVAATNADLREAVEAGKFREDLYYRLNVVPIYVPPLRDRLEDIPLLVEHFLRRCAPGKTIRVHPGVLAAFKTYRWPGNVRELQNVIERMVIFQTGGTLEPEGLPPEIMTGRLTVTVAEDGFVKLPSEGASLEEIEKQVIITALEANNWNQVRAARFLRIPRHILLYRMEKYGINPSKGRVNTE